MSGADVAKSIIEGSGNTFHCTVTNYLEDKGWHTLISPYYLDGSSNKPREIDLIVEKSWLYKDQWEGKYGTVNIKLFIECKYIPQTNVFWFGDKDVASTKEWLLINTPLKERNMFTDQHHYLASNPNVAKLFASKNKPNVENEVIYKALNQSLNSMVNLRHQQSIIPEKPNRNNDIIATIEMPVILCNSFEKFYGVDMFNEQDPQPLTENFQLEVNYAYLDQNKSNRNEFFLIDVVDFTLIDNFLNQLESDIEAVFQIL